MPVDYAKNSTVSLIPAAPGCFVVWEPKAERHEFPIIAWASVVQGHDENGAAWTAVEPVFIYEGTPFTESEWVRDMKPSVGLEVRVP